MALAKTAKFVKLMIFLDDLAKTTKFTTLTTFRDAPCENCKICKINDFSRLPCENYKINKINDFSRGPYKKTIKFGKLTIFTTTLQFITHVFQLIVKVLFCVIKAVSKSTRYF